MDISDISTARWGQGRSCSSPGRTSVDVLDNRGMEGRMQPTCICITAVDMQHLSPQTQERHWGIFSR